jgi:S-adenosylmethionine synthetase
MSYLFTSESVSEGHPDKVADAISDAVLDLVMSKHDNRLRCACETLVTTDTVVVAGEYKGILHNEEVEAAVKRVIRNVGYEQPGFDWRTVKITNLMHGQSADIALGTDTFGAGDQGLMFVTPTTRLMLLCPVPYTGVIALWKSWLELENLA